MGWTRNQQKYFFRAAGAAGWNDAQRYLVLRHAGCHERPRAASHGAGVTSEGERRPSASEPRNTQAQFEICMAIAEAAALTRGNGRAVPKPQRGGTWGDIDRLSCGRSIRLIEAIWRELLTVAPEVFLPRPGEPLAALAGFVRRMTAGDAREFAPALESPASLEECDAGQLYRILEGLKAWGTRECLKRDHTPRSFALNARERKNHFARASA